MTKCYIYNYIYISLYIIIYLIYKYICIQIKALDEAGLLIRRLKGAPIKDTITIPDGGYTIVRFVADNPGLLYYIDTFIILILLTIIIFL